MCMCSDSNLSLGGGNVSLSDWIAYLTRTEEGVGVWLELQQVIHSDSALAAQLGEAARYR